MHQEEAWKANGFHLITRTQSGFHRLIRFAWIFSTTTLCDSVVWNSPLCLYALMTTSGHIAESTVYDLLSNLDQSISALLGRLWCHSDARIHAVLGISGSFIGNKVYVIHYLNTRHEARYCPASGESLVSFNGLWGFYPIWQSVWMAPTSLNELLTASGHASDLAMSC